MKKRKNPTNEQKMKIQNLFFVDKLEIGMIAKMLVDDEKSCYTNTQSATNYIFKLLMPMDKNVNKITYKAWLDKTTDDFITEELLEGVPLPEEWKINYIVESKMNN